jgi:hypothetical protein
MFLTLGDGCADVNIFTLIDFMNLAALPAWRPTSTTGFESRQQLHEVCQLFYTSTSFTSFYLDGGARETLGANASDAATVVGIRRLKQSKVC